jgi:periodic tryptophan protein 2
MKTDFKFANLCGTVYKKGNLIFTPDGNSLISPVGNRVTVFDLVSSKSYTLPFENRKDIARIAISPNGYILITVDVDGRALVINLEKRVLLHRHSFKEPVFDLQYSPDSRYIAVTHGNQVQVWQSPGFSLDFQPFVLFKTFTGHYDLVTNISWSPDSRYFLTSSKDMTARLFPLDRTDFAGACLTGHNDSVIGAWFNQDSSAIYSVSKDGALYEWLRFGQEWSELPDGVSQLPRKKKKGEDQKPPILKFRSSKRHYFNQNNAKVVTADFHPRTGLLSVGFDSGIFGIWELPDFVNVQTLR